MRNNIFIGLGLAVTLLTIGCKKDDDSTSQPSLTGLSITQATLYVAKGTEITFKANASSIKASDNTDPGTLGIYWQVNTAQRDTLSQDITKSNPAFVYKADTLGTYIVYGYVYAVGGGYYNSSASSTFYAIDPETSLTGINQDKTETVDGKTYPVTTVGGKTWMARNLYGTAEGTAYLGCEVMDSVFGRYYSWEEAQTACPDGWHLPSAQEFDASLGTAAGALMAPDAQFQAKKLWAYWPEVNATNSSAFNAIPTGYKDRNDSQNTHSGYTEYACWWTSSEEEDGRMGAFRYIYEKDAAIHPGKGDKKTLSLSVRCVKD